MRTLIALAMLLLLELSPALAVEPSEMLSNPALEARARTLSRELRCMVCQNQSIDDSNAPLARDLRLLLRERLTSGDSDRQVIDFLVARYGEFVLLRPRFEWHTALLWAVPPAALLIGAIALFMLARRREELPAPEPLSEAERARLAAIEPAPQPGASAKPLIRQ